MKKTTTFIGAFFIIISFTLMAFYFLGDIRAQNVPEEINENPGLNLNSNQIPGPEEMSLPLSPEPEAQIPMESMVTPELPEEEVEKSPFLLPEDGSTQGEMGNKSDTNEQEAPSKTKETPSSVSPPVDPAVAEVTEVVNSIAGLKIEVPLNYNPLEYRDPFAAPIRNDGTPLVNPENPYMDYNKERTAETLSDDPLLVHFLKDYQVVGLIWGVKKPRAMVKLPTGRVVTISPGMRLGREGGVVRAIREKEVVFIVPDRAGDYKKGSSVVLQMRN